MYFKSLELIGFKSFVDETKLEFEEGITAIVGPNGCGKSNICDAIRWVLGEQSSKMLRGNKMDDFIFNGSEVRKPLNIAEVSLTITNLKGAVTAPGLSAYEDITVARRLFRSGESEYYINKTPCRLKDVVDLFLDTGVSTRGFSIIEQGQVNKIISSKPEDRRFIIEEAAGVMKYKHRRNAAIHKLESSQQNLLRIGDIVGELERQMNSLKRQANKAERYKNYRGEMKELGLKILSSEIKNVRALLGSTETEYNSYKEKEVEASARGSSAKNRLETLRTELTTEEKTLSGLKQEEFELVSRIERDEEHIELMKKRLDDLSDEDIRAGEEIEGLKKEIEAQEIQYKDRIIEMESIMLRIEDTKRFYEEK
ncbi:MAG: AAA family ATPase, partial [Nitrospirae bacterium]|nr:AAA family ATPase [Nitrospirota bacterium]